MTTEEILALKPEADKIMSIPGQTKGNSLKTDADFIIERQGEEGLAQVENAVSLLGYPIQYNTIQGFDWHPEAQAVLGIYMATKLFEWEEKDLFDMGYAAPATSLIVKMMMRFVSLKATFRQAPTVWEKHYDFGELETISLDRDKKHVIFRITGYPFFEYMDPYFDGFLTKTLELVITAKDARIERKACTEDSKQCRLYTGTWS